MDHSKEQTESTTGSKQSAANINIDINGDEGNVKNMNLDAGTDSRVGLNKDELMKYANQPFWVRLRNGLFVSFWAIWVAILVIAISIVFHSPGCAKLASAANITAAQAAPVTVSSTTPASI